MKKLLLTLAFAAAATVASYAQGTITFANTVASRIMLDADGSGPQAAVAVPGGTALNYGVFWGAAGTAESGLTLNEGPVGTAHATSAGIINAGSPYQIVGGAELSTVSIQIRAWSSSFGRDWETASRTSGALYGKTDVRQVRLAATAGPGTIIWQGSTGTAADRFTAFTVSPVPEPSTIALAVLGLGSLLLFRRRK
jgi:hypothetical protein